MTKKQLIKRIASHLETMDLLLAGAEKKREISGEVPLEYFRAKKEAYEQVLSYLREGGEDENKDI